MSTPQEIKNQDNNLVVLVINTLYKAFLDAIGAVIHFFANKIVDLIFYLLTRFKNFVQYSILEHLGIKDRRIIYGTANGRVIFDYPSGRNQATYIMGKPGFGKSALATSIAIQNLRNGTAGVFIDPHGNPYETDEKKQGAILNVYQRAKNIDKVVFLSIANQKTKVIGCNFLFLIGSIDALDSLKDELMNSIFYDSLEDGYQVAVRAKFLLESTIYAHNAYRDWLKKIKSKSLEQIKIILYTRQITINDLAGLKAKSPLIDLFITLLGFEESKYYRPDLVLEWQEIKKKSNFDIGLIGVIGRLAKIVSTTKGQLFFESSGFNLIQERLKGKYVLCDTSGLDKFTRSSISRIIYVKIYTLHLKGVIRDQTEFQIDEAPDIELPNYDEMLSQGRKFKLALTSTFQYLTQFKNPRTAQALRKAVVTKIIFRSEEVEFGLSVEKLSCQPKRECTIINNYGTHEKVMIPQLPKIKRTVQLNERGVAKEVLRERMMKKKKDIYAYFMNV